MFFRGEESNGSIFQLKISDSNIVKYINELLWLLKILFSTTTWKWNMQLW